MDKSNGNEDNAYGYSQNYNQDQNSLQKDTHITNFIDKYCDHPDKLVLIEFEKWFNEMHTTQLETRAKDQAIVHTLDRVSLIERLLIVEEMRIIREQEDIMNKLKNLDTKSLNVDLIKHSYGILDSENFPRDVISKFGQNPAEIDDIMTNQLRILKMLQQNYENLKKSNQDSIDGEELTELDYILLQLPKKLHSKDYMMIDGEDFDPQVDDDFIQICDRETDDTIGMLQEDLRQNDEPEMHLGQGSKNSGSFCNSMMMFNQFSGQNQNELLLKSAAIYPDVFCKQFINMNKILKSEEEKRIRDTKVTQNTSLNIFNEDINNSNKHNKQADSKMTDPLGLFPQNNTKNNIIEKPQNMLQNNIFGNNLNNNGIPNQGQKKILDMTGFINHQISPDVKLNKGQVNPMANFSLNDQQNPTKNFTNIDPNTHNFPIEKSPTKITDNNVNDYENKMNPFNLNISFNNQNQQDTKNNKLSPKISQKLNHDPKIEQNQKLSQEHKNNYDKNSSHHNQKSHYDKPSGRNKDHNYEVVDDHNDSDKRSNKRYDITDSKRNKDDYKYKEKDYDRSKDYDIDNKSNKDFSQRKNSKKKYKDRKRSRSFSKSSSKDHKRNKRHRRYSNSSESNRSNYRSRSRGRYYADKKKKKY